MVKIKIIWDEMGLVVTNPVFGVSDKERLKPVVTNLSSGFLTKRDSNQCPQLQRLARKVKFHLFKVKI